MVNSLEVICLWYQSISITEDNKYFENCHRHCKGYDKKCEMYKLRRIYFKTITPEDFFKRYGIKK